MGRNNLEKSFVSVQQHWENLQIMHVIGELKQTPKKTWFPATKGGPFVRITEIIRFKVEFKVYSRRNSNSRYCISGYPVMKGPPAGIISTITEAPKCRSNNHINEKVYCTAIYASSQQTSSLHLYHFVQTLEREVNSALTL